MKTKLIAQEIMVRIEKMRLCKIMLKFYFYNKGCHQHSKEKSTEWKKVFSSYLADKIIILIY